MKRFKFQLIFVLTLIFVFPPLNFAQEKDLGEVRNIREDIQIINLLNSLDLKKEQMRFIIEKAKATKSIRSDMLNQISAYESEMFRAFKAIKKEVVSGRVTVEREEAQRFRKIKDMIEETRIDAQKKIDTITEEVEAKLEPFQLIALDGYKPCIIPIMTNGRIGQADGAIGISRILERVKSISELTYAQDKYRIVKRLLDRIETRLHAGVQVDRPKAQTEIFKLFERARNMDDVDFQIQKTSLAEELHSAILPQKSPLNRAFKIKKFLLSENVIHVLEEKLARHV